MTINVHVQIVRVKNGDGISYQAKCPAFDYFADGDTVGKAFVGIIKKLAEVGQGIHWSVTVKEIEEKEVKKEE